MLVFESFLSLFFFFFFLSSSSSSSCSDCCHFSLCVFEMLLSTPSTYSGVTLINRETNDIIYHAPLAYCQQVNFNRKAIKIHFDEPGKSRPLTLLTPEVDRFPHIYIDVHHSLTLTHTHTHRHTQTHAHTQMHQILPSIVHTHTHMHTHAHTHTDASHTSIHRTHTHMHILKFA